VATVSTIHAFIPCLTASSQLSGTPDELLSASLAPSVVADNRTSNHLRQAILAFLPHGGVIDRLGEPRESSRAIARDTLVQLGLTALKYGTPQSTLRASRTERSEVPYSIFEKYFREVGFSSKVWRVREQVRSLAGFALLMF
jgi:CLIP-associating protein 1/2